jgi:raffinose/stachyose/melibiose transport system permease protein
MERLLRDKKAVAFFIFPALTLFVFIIVIPIAMSGYYSLHDWDGIGAKEFIALKNYADLFIDNSDGFPAAVLHSLFFALCSVFIQLPFSLFLALVLARGIKLERFYISTYFMPVIISTTVVGQLWMKIYNPQYGLLNNFLNSVGLEKLTNEWLGNPDTALVSVILAALWQYIGYHMLLMYTAIKSIPSDIFEASKIDGASSFQTSIYITIPNIKPILKTCVTFAVVGSLKSFDLIYVMTRGGPAGASEVPSTLMVETIFFRNMYGYGSSMAVFIIFMCFAFAYSIKKLFKTEA